jgi:hypothetical protein
MSQVGYVLPVSLPARSGGPSNTGFFTEALAQNAASAMYNVPMQLALSRPGRVSLIRAIECITDENFGPEFNFFSAAAGFTTNPDTDKSIGRFGFVSAMGERLGGSGLWRYYNDGMAIPYFDLDTDSALAGQVAPSQTLQVLHVILQNIDATAKAATSAGAGRINTTIWLEFMAGY